MAQLKLLKFYFSTSLNLKNLQNFKVICVFVYPTLILSNYLSENEIDLKQKFSESIMVNRFTKFTALLHEENFLYCNLTSFIYLLTVRISSYRHNLRELASKQDNNETGSMLVLLRCTRLIHFLIRMFQCACLCLHPLLDTSCQL